MPGASSLRLAVCFGGPSPEHDVSILTGLQAVGQLRADGRDVFPLYWSKTGDWHRADGALEASAYVEGVPRGAEPLRLTIGEGGGFGAEGRFGRTRDTQVDVVVNCCHGGPGEDGTLQGAFDLAGVAYTGPSAAAAAIGMDKLGFAALVEAAGLPTLPRRLLDADTDAAAVGFDGPYVVKPRFGGSSIGVEVVADLATALDLLTVSPHLRAGAVLEPYRGDLFDLNMAVRAWPSPQLSAIERPERTTTGAPILNYKDKYVGGEGMASAPRQLPAQLDPVLAAALRAAAGTVLRRCGVRGVARVDFLSDGAAWFVNEINTIPGSLARYLWVDPPVSFTTLLDDLIDEATARPPRRPGASGADGAVLRSAGAIAAKLG